MYIREAKTSSKHIGIRINHFSVWISLKCKITTQNVIPTVNVMNINAKYNSKRKCNKKAKSNM